MKIHSKIITEKTIKSLEQRWYGGGKEIQVGDKIIFGFTVNYANLYGTPPSVVSDNLSLSLTPFVLPKNQCMIFQLYKK